MTRQTALARARERRRELDRARGDQDARIEAATAAALLALEVRAEAARALDATQADVAVALRQLLAEGVSVSRAAALLELDAAEVRRVTRAERLSEPRAAIGGDTQKEDGRQRPV
ncbi:hypothetical protein ACXR2U_00925 [Jatrophihabitans sp. YIM 134969]